MWPKPGDVLHVTRAASVQFADGRDIFLSVIRVVDVPTWRGWLFVEGYVIEPVSSRATGVREVYVRAAGLRLVPRGPISAASDMGGRVKTSADPEGAASTARPWTAAK